MPRPNKPRRIGHEQALAARIAFERETRGWSYEGLASRMEKAGCAINGSAIYKIERADPPRRVTVDEFVAFARVFQVPIEELLLPATVARQSKLMKGLDDLAESFFALRAAQDAYDDLVARLSELADQLGFSVELPAASSAEVNADVVWIVGFGGAL
jgi:transcriptional regulator with XRE-family HTH domain